MNDVIFNKQQGGLGRALPGQDFLSAMLFYTASLPAGFTSTYNKKQIFAVSDAEALGIVTTYSDETPSRAIVTISGSPTAGDTLNLVVTETNPNGRTTSVNLGTGVAPATPTATTYAAAVVAAINALTFQHGYTATNALGVITAIARPGLGLNLNPAVNATPLAITATGTGVATITQQFGTGTGGATAGIYSQLAVYHYHIARYFDRNPQGNLWLGFYPVPGTYNFTELQDLQTFANGTIRQTMIFHLVARSAANVASDCTAIQAVNATLETLHMPMSVIYAPNIKAIADISTLQNLGTLVANKASVCIAQDGNGLGAQLFINSGISITSGGACLGDVSTAAVNEDIAWIAKFNVSNGVEDDTIALSNGKLLTDTTITANLLNQLNSYRYIFLTTKIGISGSYWNDSHTAIAVTSDYAYIENNRTIDKAIRIGRAALLPQLNSPLKLNADGTLQNTTIAFFVGLLNTALNAMVRASEISAFKATIDPKQLVLSTSELVVTLKIVPIGVAREIIVNIGFTTSV